MQIQKEFDPIVVHQFCWAVFRNTSGDPLEHIMHILLE